MRKWRAWGFAASMLLGAQATAALAADDPEEPATRPARQTGWRGPFKDWFEAPKPKEPVNKKKDEDEPKEEMPAPKKPALAVKSKEPVSTVDEAAAERAQEETTLLRRLKACDKLKEIALQSNDTELFNRAESLDERARTAYAQRTAHLRGSTGNFESDEKTLAKKLAGKPRSGEAIIVPGNDQSGRVASKEGMR